MIDKDIELTLKQLQNLTPIDLVDLKFAWIDMDLTKKSIIDAIEIDPESHPLHSLNCIKCYIERQLQAFCTIKFVGTDISINWHDPDFINIAGHSWPNDYRWLLNDHDVNSGMRLMRDEDLHKQFVKESTLPPEKRTINPSDCYYMLNQEGRVPLKLTFARKPIDC